MNGVDEAADSKSGLNTRVVHESLQQGKVTVKNQAEVSDQQTGFQRLKGNSQKTIRVKHMRKRLVSKAQTGRNRGKQGSLNTEGGQLDTGVER